MFNRCKTCCKQHDDLIILQEMVEELKDKERKLEEIMPPSISYSSYDDNYNWKLNNGCKRDAMAEEIAYVMKLGVNAKTINNFANNIDKYLPTNKYDFLRDLGILFLQTEQILIESDILKDDIKQLKENIKTQKEKLGII